MKRLLCFTQTRVGMISLASELWVNKGNPGPQTHVLAPASLTVGSMAHNCPETHCSK